MDPFVGEIKMVGFNFAPRGYAFCNGQLLSIAQNTALFSLLGTTFGGDGVTTFGLPNMQSRVPMHWGQGPGLSSYVIGEVGGVENVTLLTTQMPAHSHLVNAVKAISTTDDPTSVLFSKPGLASDGSQVNSYSNATANTQMSPLCIAQAGGSQPHENTQPYLCVTFIIAMNGVFPSRN